MRIVEAALARIREVERPSSPKTRSLRPRNGPSFAPSATTVRSPVRGSNDSSPRWCVRRLNAALNQVTVMPEVVEQFRVNGAVAVQGTPEQAAERSPGDIKRFREIVVKAKIPQVD